MTGSWQYPHQGWGLLEAQGGASGMPESWVSVSSTPLPRPTPLLFFLETRKADKHLGSHREVQGPLLPRSWLLAFCSPHKPPPLVVSLCLSYPCCSLSRCTLSRSQQGSASPRRGISRLRLVALALHPSAASDAGVLPPSPEHNHLCLHCSPGLLRFPP